jgi:CheY-like chemotaxis protein
LLPFSTIIALTGWGQDSDKERSHEAGCNGHLVKPVNIADLQKLLNELLGQKDQPKPMLFLPMS